MKITKVLSKGRTGRQCSFMATPKVYILDFIPCGEANGVKAKDLTDLIGEKSVRDTRADIANLRYSGVLICCANEGYFIPENREEVIRFVRRMRNQAFSILRVIKPAVAWLREEEGQLSLDDLEIDTDIELLNEIEKSIQELGI